MYKIALSLILMPALSFAQVKPKTAVKKTPVKAAVTVAKLPERPQDGYRISAFVKGFPDGTTVALLNGQTGAPEAEAKVNKNTFNFTGKLDAPDFKIILFNGQPPYVTLFLDNSDVKLTASKDSLEFAVVTGSATHSDFQRFSSLMAPYQQFFSPDAPYDSAAVAGALNTAANFATEQKNSFVAPLAVIRYSQLSDDVIKIEDLFNQLSPAVKNSSMGNYMVQQIAELKKNAIGTMLADFTQSDTTGQPVTLASFRGKYVLIDFWASWCRPCRQENPNVVANYNKFKDKNFTVLGVSLDQSKPAWLNAINMDGLAWAHVSDLQGWGNAAAKQFQITAIPQNFLIDPTGKIIGKNLRGPALERKLAMLLK